MNTLCIWGTGRYLQPYKMIGCNSSTIKHLRLFILTWVEEGMNNYGYWKPLISFNPFRTTVIITTRGIAVISQYIEEKTCEIGFK